MTAAASGSGLPIFIIQEINLGRDDKGYRFYNIDPQSKEVILVQGSDPAQAPHHPLAPVVKAINEYINTHPDLTSTQYNILTRNITRLNAKIESYNTHIHQCFLKRLLDLFLSLIHVQRLELPIFDLEALKHLSPPPTVQSSLSSLGLSTDSQRVDAEERPKRALSPWQLWREIQQESAPSWSTKLTEELPHQLSSETESSNTSSSDESGSHADSNRNTTIFSSSSSLATTPDLRVLNPEAEPIDSDPDSPSPSYASPQLSTTQPQPGRSPFVHTSLPRAIQCTFKDSAFHERDASSSSDSEHETSDRESTESSYAEQAPTPETLYPITPSDSLGDHFDVNEEVENSWLSQSWVEVKKVEGQELVDEFIKIVDHGRAQFVPALTNPMNNSYLATIFTGKSIWNFSWETEAKTAIYNDILRNIQWQLLIHYLPSFDLSALNTPPYSGCPKLTPPIEKVICQIISKCGLKEIGDLENQHYLYSISSALCALFNLDPTWHGEYPGARRFVLSLALGEIYKSPSYQSEWEQYCQAKPEDRQKNFPRITLIFLIVRHFFNSPQHHHLQLAFASIEPKECSGSLLDALMSDAKEPKKIAQSWNIKAYQVRSTGWIPPQLRDFEPLTVSNFAHLLFTETWSNDKETRRIEIQRIPTPTIDYYLNDLDCLNAFSPPFLLELDRLVSEELCKIYVGQQRTRATAHGTDAPEGLRTHQLIALSCHRKYVKAFFFINCPYDGPLFEEKATITLGEYRKKIIHLFTEASVEEQLEMGVYFNCSQFEAKDPTIEVRQVVQEAFDKATVTVIASYQLKDGALSPAHQRETLKSFYLNLATAVALYYNIAILHKVCKDAADRSESSNTLKFAQDCAALGQLDTPQRKEEIRLFTQGPAVLAKEKKLRGDREEITQGGVKTITQLPQSYFAKTFQFNGFHLVDLLVPRSLALEPIASLCNRASNQKQWNAAFKNESEQDRRFELDFDWVKKSYLSRDGAKLTLNFEEEVTKKLDAQTQKDIDRMGAITVASQEIKTPTDLFQSICSLTKEPIQESTPLAEAIYALCNQNPPLDLIPYIQFHYQPSFSNDEIELMLNRIETDTTKCSVVQKDNSIFVHHHLTLEMKIGPLENPDGVYRLETDLWIDAINGSYKASWSPTQPVHL